MESSLVTKTFPAKLQKKDGKWQIEIPFDPNDVWGERERFHVTGTVAGCRIRGPLDSKGGAYFLHVGPAWIRDNPIAVDQEITIILAPEGPQPGNLAEDVTKALKSDETAEAFFLSLPSFYRKNYIRWIEDAKRPETRTKRIEEMMALLKEGKRER